ncbi:MAG: CDGSH iron-sulfur domain-containing protein [Planctomycetota bacterium]
MSYQSRPWVGEIPAGSHALCTCGNTQKAPYCDGAHRGSGKVPVKLTLEAAQKMAVCACGKTSASPRCDGSHSR